jgi:hypothetical protein
MTDENLWEEYLEQWLEFPVERPPDNVVVRPGRLYHYEGGFRIGQNKQPRRVAAKPKVVQTSRGAHP